LKRFARDYALNILSDEICQANESQDTKDGEFRCSCCEKPTALKDEIKAIWEDLGGGEFCRVSVCGDCAKHVYQEEKEIVRGTKVLGIVGDDVKFIF